MARAHTQNVTYLVLLFCCKVWAAGDCQESDKPPSVKPRNSTYLEVSWEGMFSNCASDQNLTVEVFLNGDVIDPDLFSVAVSETKFYLEKDPCRRYDIRVLGPNSTASLKNNYNFVEEEPQEAFGGYLKDQLEENFCDNRAQPLNIPESLKECVKNNSWNQYAQTVVVSVDIFNPKHLSEILPLNITFDNMACSATGSSKYIVIAAVGCAIVIAIVTITLVICKRCKATATTPKEESDLNDMYGQYEFDDINGELVRMGSAWGTEKSPDYDYEENAYNRRSQVQVMDQNGGYGEIQG